MGLLDWLGIGGGGGQDPAQPVGLLDPRAIRQQALFQGLGALGAGLMAAGQRRPVNQPGPGVGEAFAAFPQAYQRGLLGGYQQRAMEQGVDRERRFGELLAQVQDPQQRALLGAVPPEAAATAMLTSQLRPRGRPGTAAEHAAAGVPMGNLWFDHNERPHLVNGPAVAALMPRVVPPGGEIVAGAMPAGMPAAPVAAAPAQGTAPAPRPMLPRGPAQPPASGLGSADEPIPADGRPGYERPFRADDFDPPDAAAASSANQQARMGGQLGGTARPQVAQAPSGGGGGQLRTLYRSSQPPPGSPERAFDTQYGRQQGDAAAAIHAAAQTAQQRLDEITQLRTALQALREAGGTTGAGAGVAQMATRALQALGVSPETFGLPSSAAPGEVVTAVANRLAMTMVGPGGLPANNFSEADRNFLVQSMPNLANRPEANEFLANVMERAAQRAIEMENRWIDARSRGQDYTAFLRDWRQYVNGNPIISQQDRATASRLLGGPQRGGGPAASPAAPPPPTMAVPAPQSYGRGQEAPLPARPGGEPAPQQQRAPIPPAGRIRMMGPAELGSLRGRAGELNEEQRRALDARLREMGF